MSNKKEKSLRRLARKEYEEKAIALQNRAIESWINNLLRKPLKIRIKVAWQIVRGLK